MLNRMTVSEIEKFENDQELYENHRELIESIKDVVRFKVEVKMRLTKNTHYEVLVITTTENISRQFFNINAFTYRELLDMNHKLLGYRLGTKVNDIFTHSLFNLVQK